MGEILNITNFNLYCGRYARKARPRTPERKTGWSIHGLTLEKIPVLAVRNRNRTEKWPLSWIGNRGLDLAIELTLGTLKAWQAFRPEKSSRIINKLVSDLPGIVLKFQKDMLKHRIKSVRGMKDLSRYRYNKVLITLSGVVGHISSYKRNDGKPMLGSKVMHFFYPELFPVWDTKWIKKAALRNEFMDAETIKNWCPDEVKAQLNSHNDAASEYATYLALMLKDLNETSRKELKGIENAYIRYSEIPQEVFHWNFADLTPILFEVCLLGKHLS